jgi:hypothetical protein
MEATMRRLALVMCLGAFALGGCGAPVDDPEVPVVGKADGVQVPPAGTYEISTSGKKGAIVRVELAPVKKGSASFNGTATFQLLGDNNQVGAETMGTYRLFKSMSGNLVIRLLNAQGKEEGAYTYKITKGGLQMFDLNSKASFTLKRVSDASTMVDKAFVMRLEGAFNDAGGTSSFNEVKRADLPAAAQQAFDRLQTKKNFPKDEVGVHAFLMPFEMHKIFIVEQTDSDGGSEDDLFDQDGTLLAVSECTESECDFDN